MKYLKLILIFFAIIFLNSCGYKKLNSEKINDFKIEKLEINGEKRLAYTLKNNFIQFLKTLIPFTPHVACECLELQNQNNELSSWPIIDKKIKVHEKVKIAIQINGKTKQIIETNKDLNEQEIFNEFKKEKIYQQLNNKKIIKTIFVKNRIINYLIN